VVKIINLILSTDPAKPEYGS